MPYDIGMLGDFSIRYRGERVDGPGVSRLPLLIACLAIHRDHPLARCDVAFKLWPDSTEAQAHTNLRKALHLLRQTLPRGGPLRVQARTIELHLARGDRLDLAEFEDALASAEQARRRGREHAEQQALEAAVAAYAGDLLPGCDSDWLVSERRQLRESYIQAISRLIQLLESHHQYADAIRHAQRLLNMENLREENYRTLIRLHALNDDRAAALSVYHTCASTLSRELGVDPDSSTRALYERLLHDHSIAAPDQPEAVPTSQLLVGRQREWDAVATAWKQGLPGRPRLVLLSGEAGIGKTRLAEDFLQWARRQGIRAAFAACYSAEGQASFAPVAAWLRALSLEGVAPAALKELSRILPELQRGGAPPPITESWQKQAFHDAMAMVVLGQRTPCLIMLDDIHWCDADMLAWLRDLMHRQGPSHVLLLATLRTEELPSNRLLEDLLRDLRASDQLIEIELERLGRDDTDLLAAHLLGRQLNSDDSSFLFKASEGVPLFVVEFARAGTLEQSARDKPDAMPPRLRAIVAGRLGHLSDPARTVVETAAILGREFNLDLLRGISELDESTTIAALDELWRRRLVRERGDGLYDFSHDKLREVALADISPVRTRWLNRRAAQALEAVDPTGAAARIADHYERAGMSARAAAFYAVAARRERGLFALNDALEHFTRAALFESDKLALANLHEERGDVLHLLERRDEAYRAFEQAFGLTEAHLQRARLAHRQITVSSRFEPAIARECYRRALEELEQAQGEPGYWTEWIQTKFAAIEAAYWQQNAAAVEKLLKEIRTPVERHGTLFQKIHFRHQIISGIFLRKRYRLTRKDAQYAAATVTMARRAGNPYLLVSTVEAAAMAACFADSMEAGERGLNELIDLSQKLADDNTLRIGRNYLALLHRRLHRPQQCLLETQLLSQLLQRGSRNEVYEAMAEANYAWLAYHQGRKSEARRRAQAAMSLWKSAQNAYPFEWCALMILLALALDAGKLEDALSAVQAMLEPPQQVLAPKVELALRLALQQPGPRGRSALSQLKRALTEAKAAGYL